MSSGKFCAEIVHSLTLTAAEHCQTQWPSSDLLHATRARPRAGQNQARKERQHLSHLRARKNEQNCCWRGQCEGKLGLTEQEVVWFDFVKLVRLPQFLIRETADWPKELSRPPASLLEPGLLSSLQGVQTAPPHRGSNWGSPLCG